MLTESDKRLERKEIELISDIRGVNLRLGHILMHDKPVCDQYIEELDHAISWELGIEPNSEVANLLNAFKLYLEKKC